MWPNQLQRGASAAPSPQTGGALAKGEEGGKSTNVDNLLDAVGMSGVDVGEEEERLRIANERYQASTQSGLDRSRKQDFLDTGVLAECVKKIAAIYSLRTLEPDTIPLIALATRQRLSNLIQEAMRARDHRLMSSHLRPPPFTTKRVRAYSNNDPSEDGPNVGVSKRRKVVLDETGNEEPGWDTVIYDEPEKWLGVLERVDREEERKVRRERMLRDEKEQFEKEAAESAKAHAEAAKLDETTGVPDLTIDGKDEIKPKEKKQRKKKEKEKEKEKNLSEDVKKRLTDQIATRQLGGKSFAWANGGFASSLSASGAATPVSNSISGLPKPKFAPRGDAGSSALPPPTFAPGGGFAASGETNALGSNIPSALTRLADVPALHDANRRREEIEEWTKGKHVVELSDMMFVLDRERGSGVGKGSGRNAVMKARMTRK